MNERIKELKKQAWEYTMAVHDGHIVPPLDKEVWPIDKVLDEKFAELIVKECADIINHRADTSADYLDSNKANDHARQVQRDCATTIKQHFGVE